jgi:hypothetical protein
MNNLNCDSLKAISNSGIVKQHAHKIAEIAKSRNEFILIRPVNKDATQLIEENYGTKGLHIKPKSSNWGPQAGFICVDSNLSKCHGNFKQILANQTNIEHALEIDNPYSIEVPLMLSEKLLKSLLESKKIELVNKNDQLYVGLKNEIPVSEYLFSIVKIPNPFYKYKKNLLNKNLTCGLFLCGDIHGDIKNFQYLLDIQFKKIIDENDDCGYIVKYKSVSQNSKFKNLMVIAALPSCFPKRHFEFNYKQEQLYSTKVIELFNNPLITDGFLPVTADYDLFAVCPYLGSFKAHLNWQKIRKQSLDLSDVTHVVSKALNHDSRRKSDVDYGIMSDSVSATRDAINRAAEKCGYKGGNVAQHGVEMDNLLCPNIDFPISIFTPEGRILTIEPSERSPAYDPFAVYTLFLVLRRIARVNYAVYRNRSWSQIVESDSNRKLLTFLYEPELLNEASVENQDFFSDFLINIFRGATHVISPEHSISLDEGLSIRDLQHFHLRMEEYYIKNYINPLD